MPDLLTQPEVVREHCRIAALVYRSIADYQQPSDGFCDICPHSRNPETFRNDGHVIDYIRAAVVEKLKLDGYTIAKGFDPETGKEQTDAEDQSTEDSLGQETSEERSEAAQ